MVGYYQLESSVNVTISCMLVATQVSDAISWLCLGARIIIYRLVMPDVAKCKISRSTYRFISQTLPIPKVSLIKSICKFASYPADKETDQGKT